MRWRLGNLRSPPNEALYPSELLLTRWPSTTDGRRDVFCYQINEEIWVINEQLGAIRFDLTPQIITAFPPDNQSLSHFVTTVGYYWLPLAYQYWGIQVFHASAIARSGGVVALVGPTQVGKSTLAYGFSRLRGWEQIADDRLAFSTIDNQITLIPIENKVRLRPASKNYFATSAIESNLDWPQAELDLQRIYFLVPFEESGKSTKIKPLGIAEAQKRLLSQAYALATVFPNQNRRMMYDYLELVSKVSVFEFRYPRSFAKFRGTINFIENHLHSQP